MRQQTRSGEDTTTHRNVDLLGLELNGLLVRIYRTCNMFAGS